jgi:nucleoside-diphosphate-sugar epimerase
MKHYLVTGGTGFIGRALVTALVERGDKVRSLDDDSRGSKELLKGIDVECLKGDVRDFETMNKAVQGVDCVCHLAYINGTNTFYERPVPILDIAVRGIANVIQACLDNGVLELSLASSPEAYQTAPVVPTDELVALSVPNPLNPRYSYGGGKIISELMVLNYGREHFEKVTVFRPHSIYGPNMGSAHVIPQLVNRIRPLLLDESIKLPIQGTGKETRSFCYIDDAIQGILAVMDKGQHLNIYHIGTQEEVTIEVLAKKIGRILGRDVEVVPSELQWGSPVRRCPDIAKISSLGYKPKVSLDEGLQKYIKCS